MDAWDLGMSRTEAVSSQKCWTLVWHVAGEKCRFSRFLVGDAYRFSPRCASSMVWPGLLLEERNYASWSPNHTWSLSCFQTFSVVSAVLGSHTCTGPEQRADPHGKQADRNQELCLNVVAAIRSRKGTERSSVGGKTERKGKTRDEKKWGYLPCTVRSRLAHPSPPVPPPSHVISCWTSFSTILTLMQDDWEMSLLLW